MTEMFEAAEEIIEEKFPPKPGGLVDRHRKREADRKAAEQEAENADEPIEQPSYRAVKVAAQSPEGFSAQTVTIAAGGNAQLLPLSPYRFRATILVVTAASSITLAKDSGAALGGVGFILPTGVPVPVYSRGQLFAFNPGAGSVQVSVMSEIYSPEQ
jgi:hypothetical protein